MRLMLLALLMTASFAPAGSVWAQDVLPRVGHDRDRPGGAPDRGQDRRGGGVSISPEIIITRRPKEMPALPDEIVGELGRCRAAGVVDIGACLWDRHSSVSIRRLEACLRSETIPDDATQVQTCLAAAHW